MKKLLVIADDLSGAAEIGGIAFLHGLSVRIVFVLYEIEQYKEDLIILDLNSRNLSSVEAYKKTFNIIESIKKEDYQLVFKKIDSVLRGKVFAEISAIIDQGYYTSSLLIPANPSRKRHIKAGDYYVNGIPVCETEFQFDPDYPRKSNSVAKLILDNEDADFIKDNSREVLSDKFVIPDVISDQDIVNNLKVSDEETTLFAGAADFFKVLIGQYSNGIPEKNFNWVQEYSFSIFVLGSFSENCRKLSKTLIDKDFLVFHLPEESLGNSSIFKHWKDELLIAVKAKSRLVIAAPKNKILNKQWQKNISDRLSETVKSILRELPFNWHVFIEGGETAASFCKTMDYSDLVITGILEEGVVQLKSIDNQILTIKPGSYNWPSHFLNLF